VVDANVVVAALIPEELSGQVDVLLDGLWAAGETLIAPGLLTAEVTSVLRNAVYTRRIARDAGDIALEKFKGFPIGVREMTSLTDSAWAYGAAVNATRLYDMYYVALADREGCDLWTADRRLVNLVGAHFTRVRWVGDVNRRGA
jgi:predicted nucleic acid-binding protein